MADAMIDKEVSNSVLPPISDKAVMECRIKGLTCEEIGKQFGVTRQAISKRLRSAFRTLDKDEIAAYKANKVGFLEDLEVAILSELGNPDKLEKASANNLAYSFGQIHNARRLEAGQSTENIGLAAVVAHVEADMQKKNNPPSPTQKPKENPAQPA